MRPDMQHIPFHTAPPGATHVHNMIYYKVGLHGFVYRYSDSDGWVKSSTFEGERELEDIAAPICELGR